jgi:GNAT superfamily N-acetyltransferase
MMTSNKFLFVEFDPLKASDEMFEHYFDLDDEWEMEEDSDEPLYPRESRKKFLLDPHPNHKYHRWLIYSDMVSKRVIGYGGLRINSEEDPNYEENKHVGIFSIFVTKEFRRKKLGSIILRTILEKAKELKRISILQSGTLLDSGKKFLTYNKGEIANEWSESRLYFREIDWELMEEWKREGLVKAEKDGITLLSFFECPEEIIEKYMQIYTETFNQQPIGELEGRPKFTPETRRLDEKRLTEKGVEWYTIVTKEKNETISGLTEYFYYSEAPHKIDQGLTGVKVEFRGRGLGKWLKAEMILHIKKRFPNLKYFGTMNATQNAAMLSINERMGFKEHFIRQFFKFKLEELDNIVD